MKHRSHCRQTWQAEAIDDGRLAGTAQALFERHSLSCPECASEWSEVNRLRETLTHLPAAWTGPFVRRRLRLQLIERVARDWGGNERPSRGRRAMAVATAVLVVAALAFGMAKWRSAAPQSVTAPPRFAVEDIHLARWSHEQLGELTRVRLSAGSAAFQVHHLAAQQRFLLLLPDGEIEVHGTRFLVDLSENRTVRVAVTEGLVALRLQSDPERLLHAGESWTRPAQQADEPVTDSGAAIPPSPGLGRPPSVNHPGTGGVAAHEAQPVVDSFAMGVSAFEAGNYRRADESFVRFLAEAPADPRGEDASFLRALAHARWGDKQGAATLAQIYLVQFPSGLRRQEAERLRAPSK